MILYTPLAQSDIFPNEVTSDKNESCINYDGRSCYVKQLENGNYQLVRLLSTDPQDFLDINYQPGTILR